MSPAPAPDSAHAGRTLTLVDCVGIGINGIVGSGIYLMIGTTLAGRAGNASVVGTFVCGLLCILIALCFAECGGMFDQTGGPYVYARAAFGKHVGFVVGWLSMTTGVLGFSGVAVGFGNGLSRFLPELNNLWFSLGPLPFYGKTAITVALIATLGVINYLGVKAGARTSDFLSFAKLVPLLAFAIVGLFAIKLSAVQGMFSTATIPPLPSGQPQSWFGAVGASAFAAVFMLSGFEYVSVPAGEAKQAQRNIPIAIVGSLMGATLLYAILQTVALSVLPELGRHEFGLNDAAVALFGPKAETFFAAGLLISTGGFCAGSALVGPRYFTALAQGGYLAGGLTRISRFGTPGAAIVAATTLAIALALLPYSQLVDLSNVALFGQYIPTALAVLVLRQKMPSAPRVYRVPFGPVIPVFVAVVSAGLLFANAALKEWGMTLAILVLGVAVWAVTIAVRRAGPKPAAPPTQG